MRRPIDAEHPETGRDSMFEVDGGVKIASIYNITTVAEAEADTFVAGSAIHGAQDHAVVISGVRAALGCISFHIDCLLFPQNGISGRWL